MSWEVDQAVTQAKDDGKRMEARLQELGEEANNLEDALSETEAELDSLRAELDSLRSAPVAVEVPELPKKVFNDFLDDGYTIAAHSRICPNADPDAYVASKLTEWFREHVRFIPLSRILKDGEVAIRADVLSAMNGCIAALRADAELIPSKALDYLDAIRSNGGE